MKYNVGDVVTYRAFGNVYRTVRVTAKYDDVKNGRPGFDAEMLDPEAEFGVWGYDDQLVSVGM